MLDYHEYEKAVYNAFLAKRNEDNRFNFSVRLKASSGAERDYFIGTENGKYFGTTLWYIKVGFPGSAGDLINVFFSYVKGGNKLGYSIEFNQTKSPDNDQNTWALELIKNIEPLVQKKIGLKKSSTASQKIHNYKTKSRKAFYDSVGAMMEDVFGDLEVLIPIVDNEISRIKKSHPEFIANQYSNEEFENQQVKLKERLENELVEHGADSVKDKDSGKIKDQKPPSVPDRNIILYGPPGTGKTYTTIEKSIFIVNPGFDLKQDRNKVKEEYERLVKNGQIVFTTFHQSMSYEDFIEGIKPTTISGREDEEASENTMDEHKPIQYEIQDGVFKRLCQRAKGGALMELDFDSLWKRFFDHLMESKGEVVFKSISSEIKFEKEGSSENVLNVRFKKTTDDPSKEGRRLFQARKNAVKKIFDERLDASDPTVNTRQEIEKILSAGRSTIYNAVYNYFFEFNKLGEKFNSTKEKGNFVLIIDEINRGNVSQIFGELITLIEEDKRLGKEEQLEVVLPYSKKPFGVPANLYLIGTMNTADRSVEALDAALRRRFTFEEMAPRPETLTHFQVLSRFWRINLGKYGPSKSSYDEYEKDLRELVGMKISDEKKYREYGEGKLIEGAKFDPIEMENTLGKITSFNGIHLGRLLEIINKRIEKLLDKDHQIGHSYLINVFSIDQLKSVFKNKMIPLLQEYFFGDYGKIGLILGEKFFENGSDFQIKFKSFFDYSDDGFSDRRIYRLKDISKMSNDDFREAIIDLMS